jgi:hypothetical protein
MRYISRALIPAIALLILPIATEARSLTMGARGDDVQSLQSLLADHGFLAADSITGYFGPLTRAAVRAFQRDAGIVSDGDEESTGYGLVGPRTLRALTEKQTPTAQIPPIQDNKISSTIEALLAQLTALKEQLSRAQEAARSAPVATVRIDTATSADAMGQPITASTCAVAGQSLAEGDTITMYATANVPFGSSCLAEERICSNGVLSGSYSYQSCAMSPARTCALGNQIIPHEGSIMAYADPANGTCATQERTCNEGTTKARFKIHFNRMENSGSGDGAERIFVGPNALAFAEDQWIPLVDANGTAIIDGGIKVD